MSSCILFMVQGGESDYINASLLRSKAGEVPPWAYIATQAPLPATSAHFWACVWHQNSGVVRFGLLHSPHGITSSAHRAVQ